MDDAVLIVGAQDYETESVRRQVTTRGLDAVCLGPGDSLTATIADNQATRWAFKEKSVLIRRSEFQEGPGLCRIRSCFVRSLAPQLAYPPESHYWSADTVFRSSFYDVEVVALRIAFLRMVESAGTQLFNSAQQESFEWKAHRLLLLHDHGYSVPPSTMTSDARTALAFAQTWPKVVAKPLQQSLQVRLVTTGQISAVGETAMSRSPVLFQKFEEGENLRAFVVGGRVVFLVKILASNPVDFRGEETRIDPFSPSKEFRTILEDAAKLCRTTFTAIDIRYRSDSDFAILELNNSPSFATVDQRFDGVISKALADALCFMTP